MIRERWFVIFKESESKFLLHDARTTNHEERRVTRNGGVAQPWLERTAHTREVRGSSPRSAIYM